jgi:hypothetical protein
MSFTQLQIEAAYDASCMTTIDLQAYLDQLLKINPDQTAAFTELFWFLITIVQVLESDFPVDQRLTLLISQIQEISHAKNESGQ